MTTLTQLKRYAKPCFTPEMQKRGFALGPKRPIYWRKKGDIYHMMWFDLDRIGKECRVMVHAWVPEFRPEAMENFPDAAGCVAGNHLYPSKMGLSGHYWNVQDEARAQESFRSIHAAVDAVAIPWWDKVLTRVDLVRVLRPEMKDRAPEALGKGAPSNPT